MMIAAGRRYSGGGSIRQESPRSTHVPGRGADSPGCAPYWRCAMADAAELKSQIKEMIVERLFLDVDPADITDDENLMETHDVDSVRLFEIVVGLEEVFDVSFEDADFTVETFSTVNSIAEYVTSKTG
ncbi:MAG TPA: hypothetical protein DGT21_21205 [Armatimonadetes bacterium]|nr:hypothetical protein [Armatimonadota bacterium]